MLPIAVLGASGVFCVLFLWGRVARLDAIRILFPQFCVFISVNRIARNIEISVRTTKYVVVFYSGWSFTFHVQGFKSCTCKSINSYSRNIFWNSDAFKSFNIAKSIIFNSCEAVRKLHTFYSGTPTKTIFTN